MAILKNQKKSQSFSADILIVVVIILCGVLYLVMNQINTTKSVNVNQKYSQADKYSQSIYNDFKSNNILDSQNKVNTAKLMSINPQELKSQLGINGDFAIVFEKNGKLVKIDPQNNVNCIGSSNIVINGVPCN